MVVRYLAAIGIASGVTFGLFFVMQLLVASGNAELSEYKQQRFVDVVQAKREETVRRKEREVEKPPEPEAPPPDLNVPKTQSLRPNQGVNINLANVDASVDIGSGGFGPATDGEYLPIVKVQPQYPRRAAERGIEGYVIVEFTVTELGTVEDVQVVEADPRGYFERAAIAAAKKFKYKPKVIDGQPVPVEGVQNLITFQLEEG